ncbi:MAG: hypothetical protein AAF065_11815 [Verrucomicrobiota bacterium]
MEKKNRVYSYEFSNYGDKPVGVQVEISNWTKDENNKMVLIPSEPDSFDQWIIATPVDFTVPPNGRQVVRFTVRPAVELSEGEHHAAFVFKERLLQDTITEKREDDLVIRNLFEIKSAVYAEVGEVTRSGNFTEFALSENGFLTNIQSLGNGHVRPSGRFQIWESGRFPGKESALRIDPESTEKPDGLVYLSRLRKGSVLGGQTKWLRHSLSNLELEKGAYQVFLYGYLGDRSFEEVVALSVSN